MILAHVVVERSIKNAVCIDNPAKFLSKCKMISIPRNSDFQFFQDLGSRIRKRITATRQNLKF